MQDGIEPLSEATVSSRWRKTFPFVAAAADQLITWFGGGTQAFISIANAVRLGVQTWFLIPSANRLVSFSPSFSFHRSCVSRLQL